MARGKKTGGGSRLGKPNKSRDEAKQLIDEVLKKHGGSKWIFEKLVELGEGVLVSSEEGDKTVVYEKEPNDRALRTLAEYRFGKPPQEIQGNLNLTQKVLKIDFE